MFIDAGARLLARRHGVRLVVYVQFSSVGVGTVWGGAALLFILGSNLGGVGPGRGLREEVNPGPEWAGRLRGSRSGKVMG